MPRSEARKIMKGIRSDSASTTQSDGRKGEEGGNELLFKYKNNPQPCHPRHTSKRRNNDEQEN